MLCEKCGKEHDGTFGSGRFCSRSCANSRKKTQEVKNKVSETLKKKHASAKKNIAKEFNYKSVKDFPSINLPVRKCEICEKEFYHIRNRKTCSKECLHKLQEILNEKQRGVSLKEKRFKRIENYAFYYTYKITNKVNNKFYYGMHMTNNLNDGYMGSGVILTKAIKKYGKDKFKKEILNYYNSFEELVLAEKELISEAIIKDKNCYNVAQGGTGGSLFKGHKHSEKTKEKISLLRKGQRLSPETRNKISESQKGRKAWNKGLKKDLT